MTLTDPRIARLITLIRAALRAPPAPGGLRWRWRLGFCAMCCLRRACWR